MKCTNCNKKEATVFYREVINGKEKKYALCDECAKEKEKEMVIPSFAEFSDPFGDTLFGSLFAPMMQSTLMGHNEKKEKKCPLCGATFSDIADWGKAGCPECYSAFSDEFAPTLSRIHGTATHRGRVPARFRAKRTKEQKIASLEEKLKTAVKEEKYEDAAKLRDELRDIRAGE